MTQPETVETLLAELGDATPEVLAAAGIAPTARAEVLGLDDWAAVARSAAEAEAA